MSATDIVNLLDGQDTPRIFKRFRMQFTALVVLTAVDDPETPLAGSKKTEALVTDVSVSGLSFTSPVSFPAESRAMIDITIGVQTFSVPVIIRRSAQIDRPGRYAYSHGAQFVKSASTTAFVPTLAKYLIGRGLLKTA